MGGGSGGFRLLSELAEKAVELSLKLGAEYADVRAEKLKVTSINYVHDAFELASSGFVSGVGLRALVDGAWGFSSTSSLEESGIEALAKSAVDAGRAASKQVKEKVKVAACKPSKEEIEVPIKKDLASIDIEEKMEVAAGLVKACREYSGKVASASAIYMDESGEKVVATSEGTNVRIKLSRVYFSVKAVAKEGGKLTSIFESDGFLSGFEAIDKLDLRSYARKASERAVRLLEAKPSPKGRFKAVLDPKIAGTFIHEAVGHACEADHVINGQSILRNKLGEQIASELVTIYDDPTLEGGWGSAKYDDEGVPAGRRFLIKEGVLEGYIVNREAAKKLNMELNGGARAESYAHKPIVRMSNTYLSPGDFSLEELLEAIKDGVYARGTRGGQVDPARGVFQFSAEEAFLVKNGRIVEPLLDVSLAGSTLETLKKIFAVGRELQHHPGFCGKGRQFIPVGDGSPHVAVEEVIVGGRI